MKRFAALCLLPLLGCASAGGLWGDRVSLDGGQSVLTGAAQRIITNTSIDADSDFYNRIKPTRIICAEPSPDVADTVSRALGVAFQAAVRHASGSAADGSGQLTLAAAASLAQLGERLATIQLLRDELADLCRSYANGAVSTTTYTLRLAKLDRKMVTLLMGEMAAGAFGRPLGRLTGSASAGTVGTGAPAVREALHRGLRAPRSPSPDLAAELVGLQQQFLSHDDLGTLLDACLTSLDLRRRKREAETSPQELIELEDLYARRRLGYERVDAAAAQLEAARAERDRDDAQAADPRLLSARIALRGRELDVAELERRIAAIEAKSLEERSRLSEYCERDMPRIRAMIEAQREDNAALRRLRSESRILEVGLPFCTRVLYPDGNGSAPAPDSALRFCEAFFRSGLGRAGSAHPAAGLASVERPKAGWVLARRGLNLRDGPSQTSPRLAGLAFGSQVAVLQALGGWLEVLAQGQRGWVHARWISSEAPIHGQSGSVGG